MIRVLQTVGMLAMLLAPNLSSAGAYEGKVTFQNDWSISRGVTVVAYLTIPNTGAAKYPAMIILHSTGGLAGVDWNDATRLNEMGVATLVIDSFGSRGLENGTSKDHFTDYNQVTDAEVGIRYLGSLPSIDTTRIGVMGRSMGGDASLRLVNKTFRRLNMVSSPPPKLAVPIYPGCINQWADASFEKSRIHFILAGRDDLVPHESCLTYAEKIRANGGDVVTTVFPDAHHSFDIRWDAIRTNQENHSACRNETRPGQQGIFRLDTGEQLTGNAISAWIRSCRTYGATIGGGMRYIPQMNELIKREVQQALLGN